MNWVGGVRCRVNCSSKRDRKIQKEYFERKRLEIVRNSKDSKREGQTRQATVSQDILPFQRNKNANAEESTANTRPNLRVVDLSSKKSKSKVGGLRQGLDLRFQTVELPASPLETPSILELSQSPINKASNLRTIQKGSATVRREESSTNNLFKGQCSSQRSVGFSSSSISLFGQDISTRKKLPAQTKYEHLKKDSKSIQDTRNENLYGKMACSSSSQPDFLRQDVSMTCQESAVLSSNRYSKDMKQDKEVKLLSVARQNKHISEMKVNNTASKHQNTDLLEQRNLCGIDNCHSDSYEMRHGSYDLGFLSGKENFRPREQVNFEPHCDKDTFQMLPQRNYVNSDDSSYLDLTYKADVSSEKNMKRYSSINEHDIHAGGMGYWGPVSHVDEMDCKRQCIQNRHPYPSEDFQVPAVQHTLDFDNEVTDTFLNVDFRESKPFSIQDDLHNTIVNLEREAPIRSHGHSKFLMNRDASSDLQNCSEMLVHNDENHISEFRLSLEKSVFPWEIEDNMHTVSDMAESHFFDATDIHNNHLRDGSPHKSNFQEGANVQRSLEHLYPVKFCDSKMFEHCHDHLQASSSTISDYRGSEMDAFKSDTGLVHCETTYRRRYDEHSVSSGIQFTPGLDIVNSSTKVNKNSCEVNKHEVDNKQRKSGSFQDETGVVSVSWCQKKKSESRSLFSGSASVGKSPNSGAAFPLASREVHSSTESQSCQTETALAKRNLSHSMTPQIGNAFVPNSTSSPENCGVRETTHKLQNSNVSKLQGHFVKNRSPNTKHKGKEDMSQLLSEMNDLQRQTLLQMSHGAEGDTESAEHDEMKKAIAGLLLDMVDQVASCTEESLAAYSRNVLVSTGTQTEQLVMFADAACSPILSFQPSNIIRCDVGCSDLNFPSGYSLRSRKKQE